MIAGLYYNERAINDLAELWCYHAERAGVQIADELSERIQTTIRQVLSHHVKAGRPRPDLGPRIHSYPVIPYIVFYRIEQHGIAILRILHGRRDIKPPLMSLLVSA